MSKDYHIILLNPSTPLERHLRLIYAGLSFATEKAALKKIRKHFNKKGRLNFKVIYDPIQTVKS